ncbi:MAG: hypothetical protein ACR2NQ_04170 [Thermodesulfobacteriota bacterium]
MEEQYKDLFRKIFDAEGEDEVHEVIQKSSFLQDSDNWYPYGGKSKDDRSNFGTFENQQSNSGAALVEKITNSIDALLLKVCKQQGIDPKSCCAPRTMEEATEKFFGIKRGDIGELTGSERTELARDNIQIVATGEDDRPDLMIYDNGEGQHPDNFKNTFLSIANNNKTDIPFVQGKYNMGSTGAVAFCGEYRYQLIASKMDGKVFQKQKELKQNLFGWTLVRRHILTSEESRNYGSSWYEYFALKGETIPQFEIGDLDIGLFGDKKFFTGSFIKLYSYQMPKGARTAIHQGLYREFNQLLYKFALPIWLYENRRDRQHLPRRTIGAYGNHVRINIDEKEVLEAKPIYENIREKDIGEIKVQVAVFKKGEDTQKQTDRRRNFIGAKRNVIYTLNGQVHGSDGVSFITQAKIRF